VLLAPLPAPAADATRVPGYAPRPGEDGSGDTGTVDRA
jgi:hypothetical protein